MKLFSFLVAIVVSLFLVPPALSGHKDAPWDHQINTPKRFSVLKQFDNAVVLDQETGLTWEQSPDTAERTWINASEHCNKKTVANRKGWRLPTIQELASLVDPTQSSPALPDGHPFSNVQSILGYWSATISADSTTNVWAVGLSNGAVILDDKPDTNFSWCVRGRQGVDLQ